MDSLARFVQLEKRKRELEDELAHVEEERKFLSESLTEEWSDRGQQSATVDGFTVYVAKDFVCSKRADVDTSDLCNVLTANGLGNLVAPAYNSMSLKSWIKTQLESGNEIPLDIAFSMNWQTLHRLKARKA